MVKLCSIISVGNVLRASGAILLCVGAPMVVVPPLAVKFFLGKREDTPKHDKKALNIAMQGLGVALTASGVKTLVAPLTKDSLQVTLCEEIAFAYYHLCNRLSGKWKDAKGRMSACDFFIACCWSCAVWQTLSLLCCDEKDDEEEKED